MSPLEDVPCQSLEDKQATRGTGAGAGLVLQGSLYSLLNLPGNRSN